MLAAKENRARDKERVTGALIMELALFQQLEQALCCLSQAELFPPAHLCQIHSKLLQFTTPRRGHQAPAIGRLGSGQRMRWLPDLR